MASTTTTLCLDVLVHDITPSRWEDLYPEDRVHEWWLVESGTPVAYMKTHAYPNERRSGAWFVLCDIEVRDGYRGRGFAREVIERAQVTMGLTLYTTGGFTPMGAAAFMGRMPVLPGHQEEACFNDMTFVDDWDRLVPRY